MAPLITPACWSTSCCRATDGHAESDPNEAAHGPRASAGQRLFRAAGLEPVTSSVSSILKPSLEVSGDPSEHEPMSQLPRGPAKCGPVVKQLVKHRVYIGRPHRGSPLTSHNDFRRASARVLMSGPIRRGLPRVDGSCCRWCPRLLTCGNAPLVELVALTADGVSVTRSVHPREPRRKRPERLKARRAGRMLAATRTDAPQLLDAVWNAERASKETFALPGQLPHSRVMEREAVAPLM